MLSLKQKSLHVNMGHYDFPGYDNNSKGTNWDVQTTSAPFLFEG